MMMQNKIYALLIALLTCALATSTQAEVITNDDARKVAQGWVTMIIELDGDWGGADAAEVVSVNEFKRGDRTLGYYCEVAPSGFLLVSLVRGLAAVKAWSSTSQMDPSLDEGPADLFKIKMERILSGVERAYGSLKDAPPNEMRELIGVDHLPTWELCESDEETIRAEMATRKLRDDYQEGEVLLSSNWHQDHPFWQDVPGGHDGCTDPHCQVGCVATAGAQIMRYWSWPPGRDWANMPDTLEDGDPAAQVNAVAELCSAIGIAADMEYCSNECLSGTPVANMKDVFTSWSYSNVCDVVNTFGIDMEDYYDYIIFEMLANRPIQYRILGHSIVCDGYRWNPIGQVHMNYGWGNSFNFWYDLGDLHQPVDGGDYGDEYMVYGIRPTNCLLGHAVGTYPRPWLPPHYRYVDQDCTGLAVTFVQGQNIQFLPGKRFICVGGEVRFESGAMGMRLHTYDATSGIKLSNGGVLKLKTDGVVVIDAPLRP